MEEMRVTFSYTLTAAQWQPSREQPCFQQERRRQALSQPCCGQPGRGDGLPSPKAQLRPETRLKMLLAATCRFWDHRLCLRGWGVEETGCLNASVHPQQPSPWALEDRALLMSPGPQQGPGMPRYITTAHHSAEVLIRAVRPGREVRNTQMQKGKTKKMIPTCR